MNQEDGKTIQFIDDLEELEDVSEVITNAE